MKWYIILQVFFPLLGAPVELGGPEVVEGRGELGSGRGAVLDRDGREREDEAAQHESEKKEKVDFERLSRLADCTFFSCKPIFCSLC